MADIICYVCGAHETVPFTPQEKDVMCRSCFKISRQIERDRVPRKKHGTRVSFPIDCSECGKHEVLTYVPKGRKIDEMLCTECMSKTAHPESKWAKVNQQIEEESQSTWAVYCVECDVKIILTQKPWPGRNYTCNDCRNEHERASEENILAGAERIGHDLLIRKRAPKSEEEE